MITTENPIGEMISFLYRKDDFNDEKTLIKDIRSLIDLIIIRTKKNGVNDTLKSLQDDLFKLRLEFINEPELFNEITNNLNNSIQDRINLQYNKTTTHKNLELAFVNSINIYNQISSNQFNLLAEDSFHLFKNIPKLDYKGFTNLIKSLPGKESKLILSYLDSSISLDYALIVSELIFDEKLKLKNTEIEKLILILKNSIEDYAVLSNIFGFWTPADEDETQWIRNIKIRISLFESKLSENQNDISSDDLKNMLVA